MVGLLSWLASLLLLFFFLNHNYRNFVLSIITWGKKAFGSKTQENVELYDARFTPFYFKRRNFSSN